MKVSIQASLLMLLVASVATAQVGSGLDSDIDSELDQLYQQTAKKADGPQVLVNVQAQPQVNTSQSQNALQSATTETSVVQKQPVTIIEASPLTESRAQKLRKAREEAEVGTEQGIVEKLEASRLEDEKRRADVLFGDKFSQINGNNNQITTQNTNLQPVQAQPIQPIVQVVPVPVREEKVDSDPELEREVLRNEIRAAIAESKTSEPVEPESSTYVSGILGVGDYPDASNVKASYAAGVAIGQKFDDRVIVEGSFVYSNYEIDQVGSISVCSLGLGQSECYNRVTNMDQYNTGIAAKYQLFTGTIRPVIGAAASYTYRSFNDTQLALSTDSSASSQAFDIGGSLGVDLELTKSFGLGVEYKYMRNVTNKVDSDLRRSYQSSAVYGEPIESLDYYTFGIVGRASF